MNMMINQILWTFLVPVSPPFSPGCYVGQELLTRTKHRGAVRRRIFTGVASDASAALAEKMQQVTGAAAGDHSMVGSKMVNESRLKTRKDGQ